MNKITIHGRLGRDPEIKTQHGAKGEFYVCNFSVAVKRSFGDTVDWFRCSAFGKQAEVISKYLKKGSEVIVYGEMQSNENADKIYWQLKVDQFEFCGSRKDAEENTSTPAPGTVEVAIDAEDLPF